MSSYATTAALIDADSAPYWSTGLFAYYRARGKLRGDPAFTEILKGGLLAAGGCDTAAVPMSAGTPFANIMLIARPRETVPPTASHD